MLLVILAGIVPAQRVRFRDIQDSPRKYRNLTQQISADTPRVVMSRTCSDRGYVPLAHDLDVHAVKNLYGNYLRQNGLEQCDLSQVEFTWKIGSFTEQGGLDAILKVEDRDNMSHADGWNKLFLLRYLQGWGLVEELEADDSIDFKVLDLQNDGILEVWVESSHMSMGYLSSGAKLLSLAGGKVSVLYENSGFDPSGAIENDAYEIDSHEVSFRDIDGDGISEILDRHVTGEYQNRDFTASEVSKKTDETTLKLVNGRFVPWNGVSDPVEFAEQEIKRLNVLWTPAFYVTTYGVYKIGGFIALAGGGYLLLESPELAVDLVSGGLTAVAGSLTIDLFLKLIEKIVVSPRQACLQIVRETIDHGWEEYKTAYGIVKNFRSTKKISSAEAFTFLKNRDGAEKMALARVLREQMSTHEERIDQEAAGKIARTLTEKFANEYQHSLGMSKPLPLAEAALFIRDACEILRSSRAGIMDYQPYLDFNVKMAAINSRRIKEARQYYPASEGVLEPRKDETAFAGEDLFLIDMTERRVGRFVIGMTPAEIRKVASGQRGKVVDASDYGEGGAEWPVMQFLNAAGNIALIFTFDIDYSNIPDTVPAGSMVTDITILDGNYATGSGIRVGRKFSEVREMFGEGHYFVDEGGSAQVIFERVPRVGFGISKDLWTIFEGQAYYDLEEKYGGKFPLDLFPDDVTISLIRIGK
ncbi:MAG: hypothetical protein RB296_01740 [Acidobacteriota bacterium]|nr:hypothetical protein [Acidobacteriota bacterium]